jgi:ribosome-binding factor A
MKSKRTDRLASQIVREIADILMRKLSDPRLHWVSVARADVSPDMREAKVFIRTLEDGEKRDQVLEALKHAEGFIRWELGKRLEWRVIPVIHFLLDTEMEKTENVLKIIEHLHIDDEGKSSNGGTEAGA